MRTLLSMAALATIVLSTTTASAEDAKHWFCTGDGIKSWTSDATATDAHGWTFSGDRTKYKTDGACKKS